VARRDREDPHLEDQLAWLDAIKEMPDEVEITITSPFSAPAPSPQDTQEIASPYPKDPWQFVPKDPLSGALFRGTADTPYGPAPASGEAREGTAESGIPGAADRAGAGGAAPAGEPVPGPGPGGDAGHPDTGVGSALGPAAGGAAGLASGPVAGSVSGPAAGPASGPAAGPASGPAAGPESATPPPRRARG